MGQARTRSGPGYIGPWKNSVSEKRLVASSTIVNEGMTLWIQFNAPNPIHFGYLNVSFPNEFSLNELMSSPNGTVMKDKQTVTLLLPEIEGDMEIVLENISNPREKGSFSALGIRTKRCLSCAVVDENMHFGFFYITHPKNISDLVVSTEKNVELGTMQNITLNYTTMGMFEGDGVGIDLASGWTSTPNATCTLNNYPAKVCVSSQPSRLTLFSIPQDIPSSSSVLLHVAGLKAPEFMLLPTAMTWRVFTFASELTRVSELGSWKGGPDLIGGEFTNITWKPTLQSDVKKIVTGLGLFMDLSFTTSHTIQEKGNITVTFDGVRMDKASFFCGVLSMPLSCLFLYPTTLQIANLPEIPANTSISLRTFTQITRPPGSSVTVTISSYSSNNSESHFYIDRSANEQILPVVKWDFNNRVEMEIEFTGKSIGQLTQQAEETVNMNIALEIGNIERDLLLFCPWSESSNEEFIYLSRNELPNDLVVKDQSLKISKDLKNQQKILHMYDLKLPKYASSAATAYQCVVKLEDTVLGAAPFHIEPRPWNGTLITRCGAQQKGAPITFYLGTNATGQYLDFVMTDKLPNFQELPVNYSFSTDRTESSGGITFIYSDGNRFTLSNFTNMTRFLTFPLPDVSNLQAIHWEVTVYLVKGQAKLITHQSKQPLITTLSSNLSPIQLENNSSNITNGISNSATVRLDISNSTEKGYFFAILPNQTTWVQNAGSMTNGETGKSLGFVYSSAVGGTGGSTFTSSVSPANIITLASFIPPLGITNYPLQFGFVSLACTCPLYQWFQWTPTNKPGRLGLVIEPWKEKEKHISLNITLTSGSEDGSTLVLSLDTTRNSPSSSPYCKASIDGNRVRCGLKDGKYEVDLGRPKTANTTVVVTIGPVSGPVSLPPLIVPSEVKGESKTAAGKIIDQLGDIR